MYLFVVPLGEIKYLNVPETNFNIGKLKTLIQNNLNIPVRDQVLIYSDGRLCKDHIFISDVGCNHKSVPLYLFSVNDKLSPSLTARRKIMETCFEPIIIFDDIITYSDVEDYLITMNGRTTKLVELLESLSNDSAQLYMANNALIASCKHSKANFNENILFVEEFMTYFIAQYERLTKPKTNFQAILDNLKKTPIFSELVNTALTRNVKSDTLASYLKSNSLYDWIIASQFKNDEQFYEYKQKIISHVEQKKGEIFGYENIETIDFDSSNEKKIQEANSHMRGLIEKTEFELNRLVQNIYESLNTMNEIRSCTEENWILLSKLRDREQEFVKIETNLNGVLNLYSTLCSSIKNNCQNHFITLKRISEARCKFHMSVTELFPIYKEIQIINQIKSSQEIYLLGVVETLRRNVSYKKFENWSRKVVQTLESFNKFEKERRIECSKYLNWNFIYGFFSFLDKSLAFNATIKHEKVYDSFLPTIDPSNFPKIEQFSYESGNFDYINDGYACAKSEEFLSFSPLPERINKIFMKSEKTEVITPKDDSETETNAAKTEIECSGIANHLNALKSANISMAKLSIGRICVNDHVLIYFNGIFRCRVFSVSKTIYVLDNASIKLINLYIQEYCKVISKRNAIIGFVNKKNRFVSKKSNKYYGYEKGDKVVILSIEPKYVDFKYVL